MLTAKGKADGVRLLLFGTGEPSRRVGVRGESSTITNTSGRSSRRTQRKYTTDSVTFVKWQGKYPPEI